MINLPYFIDFNSIGSSALGYISVSEQMKDLPFKIQRVFWTYFTPQNVIRGRHANIEKEMVMIAVSGTVHVSTEMQDGTKAEYILNDPSKGLYIPPMCWHEMRYSHDAVQMVIASTLYAAEDYLRDYNDFKNYGKQ